MSQLVPPRFLFRWSFPVRRIGSVPHRSGRLLDLPEVCRIPSLAELDSSPVFADVRLAWNDDGLGLSVEVRGRTRRLNCSKVAPSGSDGLHVWFDTRNTKTVHRATKFCQQFSLLPSGGGRAEVEPLAMAIPLARAREESPPADTSPIRLQSEVRSDGYWLEAWLPAEAVVGYDPSQHPQLGFHCVIRDSELGDQWLAVGSEFPCESDPSLWQTIELMSD